MDKKLIFCAALTAATCFSYSYSMAASSTYYDTRDTNGGASDINNTGKSPRLQVDKFDGQSAALLDFDKASIVTTLNSSGVMLNSPSDLNGVTVTLHLTGAGNGIGDQTNSLRTVDLVNNWVEGDGPSNSGDLNWTPDSVANNPNPAPTDHGYATGTGFAATYGYAADYQDNSGAEVPADAVPWEWDDGAGNTTTGTFREYIQAGASDTTAVVNDQNITIGGNFVPASVVLSNDFVYDLLTNPNNRGLTFSNDNGAAGQSQGNGNAQIYSRDQNQSVQPYLTVDVVPEPASLALLGMGGLLLAGRRRRKARSA